MTDVKTSLRREGCDNLDEEELEEKTMITTIKKYNMQLVNMKVKK